MNNYLILGGDLRQIYLGRMLKQQGFPTVTSADLGRLNLSLEEAIKASSVLLCPVPFTKDGKTIFSTDQKDSLKITDLLRHLTPDNTLFGGNIPDFVKDHAKEHKIPYFDFLEIEEITLENTIATAEGAIAEAIRLSPDCLHQSRCLVTGFGRCGKRLPVNYRHCPRMSQWPTEIRSSWPLGLRLGLRQSLCPKSHRI